MNFPPQPSLMEYLQANNPHLGTIEATLTSPVRPDEMVTSAEAYHALKGLGRVIGFPPKGPGTVHWSHMPSDPNGREIYVSASWTGAVEHNAETFFHSRAATEWYSWLQPDQKAKISYQTFLGYELPDSIVVLGTFLLYAGLNQGLMQTRLRECVGEESPVDVNASNFADSIGDALVTHIGDQGLRMIYDNPHRSSTSNWYHDQVKGLGIREILVKVEQELP